MAAAITTDLSSYEDDPRLFLFTSLTAGSSHIITATSRLETILKANKIPFQAIDTATDEVARRLWQRRGAKKKLPGLVKDGFVIGDLEEVEEWNEFGELKENIGELPASNAPPAGGVQGINIAPPMTNKQFTAPSPSQTASAQPLLDPSKMRPLPGATEIAARNKEGSAQSTSSPADADGTSKATDEPPAPPSESKAEANTSAAKEMLAKHHPNFDHLSAPASRIQSGTATPQPEPAGAAPTESVGAEIEKGETHPGSEVKAVTPDEIKRTESATAPEGAAAEEDAEAQGVEQKVEGATTGVQDLSTNDEKAETQEQNAAEGGDAGKTVGD